MFVKTVSQNFNSADAKAVEKVGVITRVIKEFKVRLGRGVHRSFVKLQQIPETIACPGES